MNQKNNHFVPKCLLKRWVSNDGRFDGVNVFNIKTNEVIFSSATGKNAFSFASFDNLYILTLNAERLTNLEKWFGGLENALSCFIDNVSIKKEDIFKNFKHLYKLILGLIAFNYRSRFVIEKCIQFFEENIEIKDAFAGKSSKQIVFENIVNASTYDASRLYPVEFIVWESNIPLLLCDRPLLNQIVDDYSLFPLSPNMLLSFKKAASKSTIEYRTTNEEFSTKFNRMIVESAREWIVSTDKNEVEQIMLNPPINQYSDAMHFNEFKTIFNGITY